MRAKSLDILLTVFMILAALLFLIPIIVTITDSFMTSSEISANYGAMFNNMNGGDHTYISENINS